MRRNLLPLLAALLLPVAVAAQTKTDINMVVALDRSESVSDSDAAIQIQGLAYALTHPEFLSAIRLGEHKRIGVAVIKWSSFNQARTLLPWMLIGGAADAARVAGQLNEILYDTQRHDDGSQTDVALGIERATQMLELAPTRASKDVINVIADGSSNSGHVAVVDRDVALARGITINALVMAQGSAIRVLTTYFKREVIGGPASFVMHTASQDDFARAMLRKMLIEVAALNNLALLQRSSWFADELGGAG
jgi:hypothetical protein